MSFKIGDKVKVCNGLVTKIVKIEYIELWQTEIYWFEDENGKLWNESAGSIVLID